MSDILRIAMIVAALAIAWRVAPVSATLVVDGVEQSVATRAGTVGALLVEVGVDVERGDLVSPPPSAHLRSGGRIVVEHARTVRIHREGDVRSIRTHAQTPLGMLHAAGVEFGHSDLLAIDGVSQPVDQPLASAKPDRSGDRDIDRAAHGADERQLVASARFAAVDRSRLGSGVATLPLERSILVPSKASSGDQTVSGIEEIMLINVLRPALVTVVEDGIPVNLRLTGRTVGDALSAAGVHLWDEDVLFPPRESLLSRTSRVVLRRALPFSIVADGETRSVRALAETVGDALAVAGIPLQGRDYTVPSADTALRPGLEVQVLRVVEDFLVRRVDIPFGTETEADGSLPLDEKRVIRAGEPGSKTQRIRIVYEDGEEISREMVEEAQERDPVAQRIAYGTRIEWNTVQTEAGPKRYWRKLRVYATSYSASRAGTPTWAPWYGLTRLGWPMRKGIIAVDPRIIPLRTEMYVPEYGLGVAGDTGGGLRQYHIDLGYDDDNYQSWHWWVDAYLLEPLPPEGSIPWILP